MTVPHPPSPELSTTPNAPVDGDTAGCRTQHELEAVTARFEAFMSNAPAIKWALDQDGRYVYVNNAYCDTMAVTAEQCLGRRPRDVLAPHTTEELLRQASATDQQVLGADRPIHFHLDVPIHGNIIPMYITKFIYNDPDGNRFIGGSGLDISLVKEAEAELRRLNDELEHRVRQRTRELNQFAHVAAHDLRSPLRTISGFGEHVRQLLRDGRIDEAHRYLDRILAASDRMATLIDSLLTFSTLGREEDMQVGPVSLQVCYEQVRADLATPIAESEATFDTAPLPVVQGDAALLRQLLQNLITNALKFAGDRPPRIQITTRSLGDHHEITVRDHGVGFESQLAEQAFEPFQRLHSSKDFPGHGVGLSICRRVVEHHRGRISAASAPGRGATFTFTLPKPPATP